MTDKDKNFAQPEDPNEPKYEAKKERASSGKSEQAKRKRKPKPVTYRLNLFSGGENPDVAPQSGFGVPTDFRGQEIGGELSKSSTQASDEGNTYATEHLDLIAPPYDLKFLSDLNVISVTRRACVEAIAVNTAGLGYRIKRVDPEADETDTDDVSDMIKDQLEKWAAKGGLSFSQLIEKVKYDEESNGNGYLEVSRNRKGEIDGLYHIPSHTVRVKKDRSGFIQVLQNGVQRVPFYNFGDKVELKEDGTIELLPDRDRNINELIHFRMYSHRSVYYGVPRDIAAIPTTIGDEAARAYNNKFFKYNAIPELALVFEIDATAIPTLYGDQPVKVEIDPNTKREIEEHFRRNLSAQTFEPALFHLPPGVKMRVEKLSEANKDSGFTTFREKNKAEIREAFRTPSVIISGADATYASAAIEKAIYLEQVIAPEQERFEQFIMSLLWPEMVMIDAKQVAAELDIEGDLSVKAPIKVAPDNGTGINPNVWRLDFKEMSVADKAVDATVHNIYATLGVLTINEIRMQLGMKPLPDGDRIAEPPPGAEGNTAAQNAQNAQAAAGNPEIPFVTNMAPAAKNDIRGLGDGRGPNGQITPKSPRRPFDNGGFTPANANSVGRPLMKSEDAEEDNQVDEQVVIPKSHYEELLRRQQEPPSEQQ